MTPENHLLDRQLPNATDAEEICLGAIFINNALMVVARGELEPEAFYSARNRKIFMAMREVYDRREQIDEHGIIIITPIQVGEILERSGDLDSVGGVSAITALTYGAVGLRKLNVYTDMINEKADVRSIIKTANILVSDALSGEYRADELKAKYARFFQEIRSQRREVFTAASVWKEVQTEFTDWIEDKKMFGIKTGLPELDACLKNGGFANGELILKVARPSVGKTALMLNCALQAGFLNIPSALFTLEMSRKELFKRLMPMQSGVKNKNINPTTVRKNPEARERLFAAGEKIAKLPLFFEKETVIEKMIARSWYLIENHGVRYILADYLQLMKSTGDHKRKDQEFAEISGQLKGLADDAQIPVVCLGQLNRASEINDRRPEISDIREAGASEQDADTILLPYRPDSRRKERGKNKGFGRGLSMNKIEDMADEAAEETGHSASEVPVNIFIGKQRAGIAGIEVRTTFDMDYQRFMTDSLFETDNLDKME